MLSKADLLTNTAERLAHIVLLCASYQAAGARDESTLAADFFGLEWGMGEGGSEGDSLDAGAERGGEGENDRCRLNGAAATATASTAFNANKQGPAAAAVSERDRKQQLAAQARMD